jgi:hypothetical protein
MNQFAKHYTLEEARATLPRLRAIFGEIHKSKAALEQAESNVAEKIEKTGGDVGGKAVNQAVSSMVHLRDHLLEISKMGIQIKDLDRGLVDFPSIRDGHEVFLCWELEEDDIEFWHEIESGYAGRERL